MAFLSPLWVPVKRAATFPEVIRVYKRAGRGQGTGQGIIATRPSPRGILGEPKGFLRTIAIFFQGETVQNASTPTIPSWLRKSPLSNSNDWQDAEVDVTNIPGVRSLRHNGKWTGF